MNDVEEVRTGLDIDENFETLAVATKKDGQWTLGIFQMPVGVFPVQPKNGETDEY